MTQLEVYQVDAFTDKSFGGNPAAVCLLKERISNETMKNIAAEMNLSETAFVRPLRDESFQESAEFNLRWFTPEVEVPLSRIRAKTSSFRARIQPDGRGKTI